MTPTGILVLGVAALSLLYLGLVYLLREFADWSLARESERTAAASFECDFIPDSSEVSDHVTDELLNIVRERAVEAAAERVVLEEDMCLDLDEAIAHVEGGWRS